MKIAALTTSVLLFAFAACSTTSSSESVDTTYGKPNSIVTGEIETRVAEIPFQHRDELLENLLWLAETGEPAIPSLLKGMENSEPKVRSSCAWVLGRIGDRRVISELRNHASDSTEAVRLEVCRTLVLLGDLQQAPTLIEGLDSDRREVRYMCHEALKSATGRDFGYDHLTLDAGNRRSAVLSWRKWWSDYSGDTFFASNYATRYQLNENAVPAAPMGETATGNSNSTSTWSSHNETMEEGSGSTSNQTSSNSTGSEDPTNTTGSNANRTSNSGTGSSNTNPSNTNASNTGSTNTGNTGSTTNPSSTSPATSTSSANRTSSSGSTNGTTTTNPATSGSSTNSPATGSTNGSTSTSGSTSTGGTTNTGSNSTNSSTGSGNGSTGTTGSSTNPSTNPATQKG